MEPLICRFFHAFAVPAGDKTEFGDIVVLKAGEYSNHCGIMLDHGAGLRFWHVPARGRCGPDSVLPGRVQSLLRFTGTGYKDNPAEITSAFIASTT